MPTTFRFVTAYSCVFPPGETQKAAFWPNDSPVTCHIVSSNCGGRPCHEHALVQPSELGVTLGPLGRGSQNFVGSGYSEKDRKFDKQLLCVTQYDDGDKGPRLSFLLSSFVSFLFGCVGPISVIVGFDVLTAVRMMMFWIVTPCRLVGRYPLVYTAS
jgi:hypothetical protein